MDKPRMRTIHKSRWNGLDFVSKPPDICRPSDAVWYRPGNRWIRIHYSTWLSLTDNGSDPNAECCRVHPERHTASVCW